MAKDLVQIVTEPGELFWVNITGEGKLNYNEDGYIYVATVRQSGEVAQRTKAKIDALLPEAPKGKTIKSMGYHQMYQRPDDENFYSKNKEGKILIKDENDEEEDITDECEATDTYEFRFATGVEFKDGKKKVIHVYNCAKPPQKINLGERKIGNQSIGAISGKMRVYEKGKDVGVSLFLHAIQLIKYVPYEGDAGFEEQDGDFYGFDDDTFETGEEPEEKKAAAKPKL